VERVSPAHAGEHGPLQGEYLGVQVTALPGEGDPDPAAVLLADGALDQAVLLQTSDEPRQRALAEMDPARDVLHPAVLAGLRHGARGEDVQDLEVTGSEAVRVQGAVDLAHRARVHREDVPPLVLQPGTWRFRCHN